MKTGKHSMSLKSKQNRAGYIFVLPFIIGLVAIFIPSMIQSFIFSINDIKITLDGYELISIGFSNFDKAFNVDANFRRILYESVTSMGTNVLVIIIFSFVIANILNQKFKGRTAARVIFFLPVILATGIVSRVEANDLILGTIYKTGNEIDTGVASQLFNFAQLEMILYNSKLNPALIDTVLMSLYGLYNIVVSSGVQILIFLAGLQSVPSSLFEAAYVEGCTGWEAFWKITLPMISPLILVNAVYTVVSSFTDPNNRVMAYIDEKAFMGNQYGFASAMAWIYFLVIAVALCLVGFIISRKVYYQE